MWRIVAHKGERGSAERTGVHSGVDGLHAQGTYAEWSSRHVELRVVVKTAKYPPKRRVDSARVPLQLDAHRFAFETDHLAH